MTVKVRTHSRSLKCDVAIISGGLTSQLQPADVSWNKPFKMAYRELYNEWMATAKKSFTPAGNMRLPIKAVLGIGEDSLEQGHHRSRYKMFQSLWQLQPHRRVWGRHDSLPKTWGSCPQRCRNCSQRDRTAEQPRCRWRWRPIRSWALMTKLLVWKWRKMRLS